MMEQQIIYRKSEGKQNEAGRTMVEMFGVIVIISVLALVGLGAFGMASDYFQGNRISQAVLQESALFLSRRNYADLKGSSESATGIQDLLPSNAGCQVTQQTVNGYRAIHIKLTGLKEGVCRRAASLSANHIEVLETCDTGTVEYTVSKGL